MKRPSDGYYRTLPDRLGDQLTVSLLILSIIVGFSCDRNGRVALMIVFATVNIGGAIRHVREIRHPCRR